MKKKYTDDERMNVLVALRESGYDYTETSRKTGVSPSTLSTWKSKYSSQLESYGTLGVIAAEAEVAAVREQVKFIETHARDMDKLASEAITKAIELVGYETDLSKVNQTIKVVGELFEKLSPSEVQQSTTDIQTAILSLNTVFIGSDVKQP